MRSRHTDIEPLVNLSDITEIELVILKRMREVTIGDHRSRQHGSGFDFIGLRDWQAGDKFSSIDWGQSIADQFLAARHPRVRAAEQRDGGRDRRQVALDALRRRRRADCRGRRAGDRDGRAVGGVLPGSVRHHHVRSGLPAPGRRPAANRQGPRRPLPGRLSARPRAAAGPAERRPFARRSAATCAAGRCCR